MIWGKSFKKTNSKNGICRGLSNNIDIKWLKAFGVRIRVASNGQPLLDFTSGILCSSLGYNNKSLNKALKSVVDQGFMHAYTYDNSFKDKYFSDLRLALEPFFHDPQIYLASSGTEVTEAALKISLKHGLRFSPDKKYILTVNGNYHGRTMGASLLSNNNFFTSSYPELSSYFGQIDFPHHWIVDEENGAKFFDDSIARLPPDFICRTAAFFLETFQGWAASFYPKSYIHRARQFCSENDILLVFDEMQSGFYRTGKFFGFQHYDVTPDLICCGKGMGGGSVISGLLGNSSLMNLALPGELSSTHSANPLSCAISSDVLRQMNDSTFQRKLSSNSILFESRLKKIANLLPSVSRTSGRGLVGAIIFDDSFNYSGKDKADDLVDFCLRNNLLLIKTGRESVKLAPPLTIGSSDIARAFDVIEEAFAAIDFS